MQTLESLGIDKLSNIEKHALVDAILESITDDTQPRLWTESDRQELKDAIREADQHPDQFVPWQDVKAKLDAKYGA